MDFTIIRSARRARKLKVDELAEQAGISRGYLSQIERNLKIPPLGTLNKICEKLDLELRIIPKI